MATHVIIVRPARRANNASSPGNYEAALQGEARALVRCSTTPFLDAARALLLERGFAADDVLVMRWGDASGADSLKAQLGVAARLTVQERRSTSPSLRFAPYVPLSNKVFVQPMGGSEKLAPSRPAKKGAAERPA
jgi:hypothetical protein